VFGPNGPLLPERNDSLLGERPGEPPRRRAAEPEKKPSAAEKAEALRQALAPKPSAAAVRQETLDGLFKKLASASDGDTAKGLSNLIEHIWAHSDSDTANLLMARGTASLIAENYPLALSLFDKLVALKPDWAEAWNKRATTRFKADDFDGAMADINQTLKLEPRQYNTLVGMGLILQRSKLDKQALDVYRKALAINPQQPDLRKLVEELKISVEGRDI
jgi:tetratricopeptide (TPR) repeat protein